MNAEFAARDQLETLKQTNSAKDYALGVPEDL